MKFSQRIGVKPIREILQIESIDEVLQNKLWNVISNEFLNKISSIELLEILEHIWVDYFENLRDEYPASMGFNSTLKDDYYNYIKREFFNCYWYEVYDFIEYLVAFELGSSRFKYLDFNFISNFNDVLSSEMAGYRIVNGLIIQITTEEEILTIEESITSTGNRAVVEHLEKALLYLSDKMSPDYRNSVKESISAVEAYCCFLINEPNISLGKALKKLDDIHPLHPSYKSAFEKLYGYTSDSGGIRHALVEDGILVKQEDAKFMIVVCSAFINYLKTKEELFKNSNYKKSINSISRSR
ncbi:hypothetical protein HMPREF9714_02444 [Myroides odoratimimus CCUG 12901]|uniref:AbiJ-NTD4 domain-containing protein n=1 Tax=Myroides TaxID=76831 RepID=UPI000245FC18|nr:MULTISPECIES: hypothetical protein [Myroides]AJA70672.1 hypothetical protein MYRA21_3581 [Myroides sp. A21]APA93893.1 hypothetical protein BK054_17025 [Myroides sp. ZB35]EHO07846.1 hypothetical protein HMPREF9714_02444 [Myroides odoratimimus CCUG 12901]EKB05600.1 hypothetical protein HMPREF9711_01166 [Myroides odoratimimus CCUG 3837]MCA4793778.1 hypothetical protein [Myroides odoratimimus]